MLKYEYLGDLNFQDFNEFLDNHMKKNLKLSKKNETIKEQTKGVLKLNYESFNKLIINNREHQIVLFHSLSL